MQERGSAMSFRLLAIYKMIQWQHPGTSKEVNETETKFVADGACFPSQECIPKKQHMLYHLRLHNWQSQFGCRVTDVE